MNSQAALFDGPNLPLRLVDLPIPALRLGEQLVEILATTLCASDLSTYAGKRPGPAPSILGHEILGRLDDSGQRVTWTLTSSCGVCRNCARDYPQKCESGYKYGHLLESPDDTLGGGLARHCILRPGTLVLPVPDSVPDLVAAPANCATATAAAAIRLAGDPRGANVLILGAGMLGLTASAMVHAMGAASVTVTDPDPKRMEAAPRFGATGHKGDFDIALEFSGAPSAVEQAVSSLRLGGHCILVGSVSPGPDAAFDPERVVRRLLTVKGLHNYWPRDLEFALRFLEENHARYPFADLVPISFPLEKVNEAFEHAMTARPHRVAVVPTR